MRLPISLVVIVKNEEHNLERCLRSAAEFVNEIIVVDSGSADATQAVALKYNAYFLYNEWRGFGAQKKYGALQAKNDWILSLDADEELSFELKAEINEKFNLLKDVEAVAFPRISFHLGQWIRHGGWFPDYQIRLFNKRYSMWNESQIHEKVESSTVIYYTQPIHHFVFKDLASQVKTNNRYSGLQALDLYNRGTQFSYLKTIFKPISKFIECYIIKLGFLDGFPGFIIAISAAYSVFLRWCKLWELQKQIKDNGK